jgi:hypothetical protein
MYLFLGQMEACRCAELDVGANLDARSGMEVASTKLIGGTEAQSSPATRKRLGGRDGERKRGAEGGRQVTMLGCNGGWWPVGGRARAATVRIPWRESWFHS